MLFLRWAVRRILGGFMLLLAFGVASNAWAVQTEQTDTLRLGIVSGASVTPTTIALLIENTQALMRQPLVAFELTADEARSGLTPPIDVLLFLNAPTSQRLYEGALPVVSVSTLNPLQVPDEKQGKLDRHVDIIPAFTQEFERLINLTQVLANQHRVPSDRLVIAAVVDAQEIVHDPDLAARVEAVAADSAVRLSVIPGGQVANEVIDALPHDTDAVYVGLLSEMPLSEQYLLAEAITNRGLPSMAAGGADRLDAGFLSSLNEQLSERAARIASLLILSAMDGSEPDVEGANTYSDTYGLLLNKTAQTQLGLELPWSLYFETEFVHGPKKTLDADAEQPDQGLTLDTAIRFGVMENLDLLLNHLQTDADNLNEALARSGLLPQVQHTLTGRLINSSLAESGLGNTPETLVTATVSFRQQLFSEKAWAGLSIEKRLRAARDFEFEAARLLIAESTGRTFLEVLQAEAALRVQEANLTLARENLRAANAREASGLAERDEVSRLQAALFQSRSRTAQADAVLRSAEIRLNQLLNRPLDAEVRINPQLITNISEELKSAFPNGVYVDRPEARSAFETVWISEAYESAPEIRAVAEIEFAAQRELASNRRSFIVPDIVLNGTVSSRLAEEGAGSTSFQVGEGFSIPQLPDEQWSAGVTVSLPLFTGGNRTAATQKAKKNADAAEIRRLLTVQRIESQTRLALIALESSYIAAIQLENAAQSAREALSVVRARYIEGTANVTDLLDAQRTARVSEEEAIDAAVEVFQARLALERTTGNIAALQSDEENEGFEFRLRQSLEPFQP